MRAFITGASGGIGKAFCYSLAKRKFDLFITGRSEEKLLALKNDLQQKFNIKVDCFACDLTSEIERAKMIEYIDTLGLKFAKIINVAGVDIQKAFKDYTLEKVLFQIRVNSEATIALTYSLLTRLDSGAEILTISSMSGATPMPYFALYSATKAMLTNFFTSLHYELKKDKIKVTVVLPGGVYTRPDIVKDIKGQGLWGKLSAKSPEFVAEKSLKAVSKNKVKYVPGFFNKLLNFLLKIVPNGLALRFIARRWKKISKDAF